MKIEKIGIIGVGVVGSAVSHGIGRLGFEVVEHDIKFGTSIFDIVDAEVVFICVPTPSLPSGKCDTSIVEQVADELSVIGYQGVVAIKSTVEPGTTQKLIDRHLDLNICFVPEFLRERCALSDFIDNHDLCVIGTFDENVFDALKQVHGKYPNNFVMVTPTEAELVKYFNNIYNATLITFANNFYEVCQEVSADYTKVKDAIVLRDHIQDSYLDCNKNLRGFGGVCLPKDTRALNFLVKDKGLPCSLFETLLKENGRYKITTFDGMRKGE